ncbi:Ger(x)C family spore germination protein, partial [Neobacillus drentensis]
MRNALLLIYFCGSILFVTGCWDRTEVNDLAIVTAAAIDKKENNQIELSLQLFIPKSLSMGGGQGGGGGGGGQMTVAASHKG